MRELTIVQPFREPSAPTPDPETETPELDALVARKKRRTRNLFVGVVLATFAIPALLLGVGKAREAWEDRKWRLAREEAERRADERARLAEEHEKARLAEIAKHTVPLAPADRDRVLHALDAADAKVKAHVDALAHAWPDMVAHGITPGSAKCNVDVPAPDLDTKNDDMSVTNVDQVEDAPVAWVYVDGRGEPFGKELAKRAAALIGRPPDLDPVKGLVPITPPPQPSWTRGLKREIDAVRGETDMPIHDTEQPSFVESAELLPRRADGKNQTRRYDFFAIVDVWFVPQERDDKKFLPGDVVAHSFVWDTAEDRVACAGVAVAESSHIVVGKTIDLRALNRDLRLQLERELATSLKAANARRR